MKYLNRFFENRDHTGSNNAVMSASKLCYDISKKVLKLDREEIVNIITDILDTYPELVFECVMGRTKEDDPTLHIYFYKPNWNVNGGYFWKSHFPDIDDLAEDVIGKFADIGFYSKLHFDSKTNQRFFAFSVCDQNI